MLASPVSVQPPSASDYCVDLYAQQPEIDDQPTIDSAVGSVFDKEVVTQYVATLTDRSVQRRLRDSQRNKSFRKSVLHHSGSADQAIMFESDDIVLEYSCQSNLEKCVYFFVKQQERNMLKEECVKLADLRRGKRIKDTQHTETQACAARDLQLLRAQIQLCLG